LKYLLFIFSLILFLASSGCSSTESEKTIELQKIPSHFTTLQIDNSTTFSYPSELVLTDILRYDSKFQFSDLINVQYVVVQEDNKGESLKLFAHKKLEQLQQKMVEPSFDKLNEFQLEEINGFETQFQAKTYGWPIKLEYWISIVELKHKFITTIVWTSTDRKETFKNDAELIINSFRNSKEPLIETN
jgi:hypothetical protein